MGKLKPALIGFTLIEVLIAFAILSSVLTLVAAGFSRHLHVLQMFRRSVSAHGLAERRVIGEVLRREAEVELPGEEEEGTTVKVLVKPARFQQEPVPEFLLDGVTVSSSWRVPEGDRSETIEVGLLFGKSSEK